MRWLFVLLCAFLRCCLAAVVRSVAVWQFGSLQLKLVCVFVLPISIILVPGMPRDRHRQQEKQMSASSGEQVNLFY